MIIIQFTTAAAQLVDASRVVFAFSRDDALPLSKFWKRIHPFTQTPVNATLVVALCSALLGLLALSAQAGAALFDVSVIGLYISYAIPIFLRITSGRSKFKEVSSLVLLQCCKKKEKGSVTVTAEKKLILFLVSYAFTGTFLTWVVVSSDWISISSMGIIHRRNTLVPGESRPHSRCDELRSGDSRRHSR